MVRSIFRKGWRSRLTLFLAVVGPGFITASVDNDAGGIATYSVAGAQFGYSLLWTMIPITIALVVVQEMASRMGAVTGKGLSDLIREEFGFRVTFFLMLALIATNFGNIMAEFAGVVAAAGGDEARPDDGEHQHDAGAPPLHGVLHGAAVNRDAGAW